MRHRNNGQGPTNIIQNQFTAYLIKAIKRKKYEYVNKKLKQQKLEILAEESTYFPELQADEDMVHTLPLTEQFEDISLIMALKQLKKRDLYILLAHTIEDKTFDELSKELGISYKGVAAVYYRTIKNIKIKMSEVKYDKF